MSNPESEDGMPNRNGRHMAGLDLLRFFAASGVMLYHFAFSWTLPDSTVFRATRGVARFPELIGVANFGWLGVQIFFVISGFVIAFSAENASLFSFVKSRINRLVPAAWVCTAITFAAALLLFPQGVSLTQLRHSLFFIPWAPWVDPSYWTLGVEIAFYSAIAILIALGRFRSIEKLAVLIGAGSAGYWFLYCLSLHSPDDALLSLLYRDHQSRLRELALFHHGCFFALGVYLWLHLLKAPRGRYVFTSLMLAVACMMQIFFQNASVSAKSGIDFSPFIPLAIWSASIAFMFWTIRLNDYFYRHAWVPGLMRKIGLLTYPLYLIHQVFGSLVLGRLISAGMDRYTALGMTMLLMLALSAVIASLLEPSLRGLINQSAIRFRAYVHA
jgi:peptidoglycan/LPS O-acetylase OafA/YrhL